MAMVHGCALTECMERCCIGFGRAESTLIDIIGAFLIIGRAMLCLVLDIYASCNSQFDYNGDDTRLWIDFDFAWMHQ